MSYWIGDKGLMEVLGFVPLGHVHERIDEMLLGRNQWIVTELEEISKLSFKYRAGTVNFHNSGSTMSSLKLGSLLTKTSLPRPSDISGTHTGYLAYEKLCHYTILSYIYTFPGEI